MELITLATGSTGNCYILKSSNGKFCILDCGLKFQEITSNKNFTTFADLDFVFCSHEHHDHNKSLEDFKNSGVECLSYENLYTGQKIEIGQWIIFPFGVRHNALNYGAIIYDKVEDKKLVYATDFIKMPRIHNADYWLYEINYDEFTADKVIENQDISKIHIANNIHYHNSLEHAIDYFNDIQGKPKLIVACHTSNMGGTPERIKKQMRPLCDKIEVAKKGQVITF